MNRTTPLLFVLLSLSLAACELIPFAPNVGGPSVARITPADGATNVPIGTSINAALNLPSGDLDLTTVSEQSVRLIVESNSQPVAVAIRVLNESETLVVTPREALAFNTTYRFEISSAVQDESGQAFRAHSSTFTTAGDAAPSVVRSRPADGETNVPVTTGIATDLYLPNGGVAKDSLTDETVYLTETRTQRRIEGSINTSAAGDVISFQPNSPLSPNTEYTFTVDGVRDFSGVALLPFSATFSTGAGGAQITPRFDIVDLPTTRGERHTSLAFGPDGNLYASTVDGRILRYSVSGDGTLGTPQTLTSLQQAEGGPRLTIGIAFDPAAKASNLILWVSHTHFGFSNVQEEWSGKITRLSGPNLETVQDYVVGLPRSIRDHVTNKIAFNPAEPNVLYFNQGSNTAMGAPDAPWGFRPERLLTAATLRVDLSQITNPPLNVQTEDGGSYNPFAPGAPLTIFGRGIRNAYDLVWHSNGRLYVPTNGSAAGGNVPRFNPSLGDCSTRPEGGYSGPVLANPADVNAPYLSDQTDGWRINQTQSDYLFIVEEGGYYGHPNPTRCEWIMNGGGTATDSTRVQGYSSSVSPDPNWRGAAFDFGLNVSPNGAIEYQSSTFGGALRGQLLVTRYSNFNDVLAVELDSLGNPVGAEPIVASGSFQNPLDLAEDVRNGYLYVSEYGSESSSLNVPDAGLKLLRPVQ
jgi:glucose/arabinose dehydrogenase